MRDEAQIAAWEVGTGSGAVAVALALRFRTALALGRLRLGATDVSPEALELASENLAAHGVAGLVSLGLGDLLDVTVLPAPQQPDVLVANLPYVPSAEVAAGTAACASSRRSPWTAARTAWMWCAGCWRSCRSGWRRAA